MTAELDALLAAVHDNPRDVVPKLVYADWLDERGEHEYAELIRLSTRLAANETADFAHRKAGRQRRYQLTQDLLKRWGVNGHATMFWNFDRTVLADSGCVTAAELMQGGPVWPPYFRPRSINFTSYRGHEAAVLGSEYVQNAIELSFSDPRPAQGRTRKGRTTTCWPNWPGGRGRSSANCGSAGAP